MASLVCWFSPILQFSVLLFLSFLRFNHILKEGEGQSFSQNWKGFNQGSCLPSLITFGLAISVKKSFEILTI